ncbi:unnamed protein product [Rhizophagus irregularis]|uniref:Uncharacterized protein n=1 Tax=Rhizophagus irregularis TaxID=588596 RepID=A0A915ZZI1_9GLOM|nr:unnamed protein product [Rhizophagus irregularis]
MIQTKTKANGEDQEVADTPESGGIFQPNYNQEHSKCLKNGSRKKAIDYSFLTWFKANVPTILKVSLIVILEVEINVDNQEINNLIPKLISKDENLKKD